MTPSADPVPREPLSPDDIARAQDFMGDAAALDSGGAWERELTYMASALAEPDAGKPLDLDALDERLDALEAR
jgi:hypothetical protein